MITNEELDWATDLPLAEAWKVVAHYNRVQAQIKKWPTPELIHERHNIEVQHPGITWLIDFKASHPTADEIPLSKRVPIDYDAHDKRRLYIQEYLNQFWVNVPTEVRNPDPLT